jgi:hypothetical protein
VRKQYYFRPSSRGLLAWDVDRLVRLSSALPRKHIPLSRLRELDEVWFGEDERPTWRAMLEHMKLIDDADLSFPIILSSSGAVMDGRHRLAKATRQGRREIEAVQFAEDPEPDHVGLGPDELPY